MTSVDLEGIHAIITQKGVQELIKQKGTKFTRMFHGFLSAKLLPALNDEAQIVPIEPAKIEGGSFGDTSTRDEIQTDSPVEQTA